MARTLLFSCFGFVLIGLVGFLALHNGQVIQSREAAAVESALSDTPQFQFEVVKTPEAQERGLGGRADVPSNYGMLFVFPKDGDYGFWMKGMLVSIDIIWLSDNGNVIGILPSVATSTYPRVFYPPTPVRYVLEIRAGEALRQDWNIGDVLSIPLQN